MGDVGVGLDLYPGGTVLDVGDGMSLGGEMVAQRDNREAGGVSSGLQRQCCTAGRK